MEQLSDASLIERCLQGEGDAFAALVQRHGWVAQALIRREIRDRSEAEDVLQRTLVDAWLSLPRLRDAQRFRPWLLQIARRRCRDAVAAAQRRPEPLESSALEARLDHAGRRVKPRPEMIDQAMDELAQAPPAARQVAELFYLQGLSIVQIAHRLGRPEGTIKRRLFDARAHLRSRLVLAPPIQQSDLTGDTNMETNKARSKTRPGLPPSRPQIEVRPLGEPPFEVRTPELLWWHIVPEAGQRACLGQYDPPDWRLVGYHDLRTVGPARVHRQDCLAIDVSTWRLESGWAPTTDTVFARISEEASEFLAVDMHGGRREIYTFLDEGFDVFWGSQPRRYRDTGRCRQTGPDDLEITGELTREAIAAGAWTVRIGDRSFACLRLLLIDTPLQDPASLVLEAFLTRDGRTVLQRHYAQPAALDERQRADREALGRLTINGVELVHWYDQLTGFSMGL